MFSSLVNAITLTPNKWANLNKPKYIVLHTTQGGGSGSLAWMTWSGSQVGCHYLIMEGGDIIALSSEKDAPWHAGIVNRPRTSLYTGINPNMESIGIEIAGWNTVPIGSQQVSSTAALIRDIWNRYGPLPVIKHADLDTINRFDPGDDNFNRVMAEANSEVTDMTPEDVKQEIRYMLLNQEGYDLVENAILHQYGPKLQTYLDERFAQAEVNIVNAIVERLKNG